MRSALRTHESACQTPLQRSEVRIPVDRAWPLSPLADLAPCIMTARLKLSWDLMSDKVSPLRRPALDGGTALTAEVAALITEALNLDVKPAEIDPERRCTARGWAWIRSTSWRSRWWSPSAMACSCAPTARRTSASSARCASSSTTSPRTGRSSASPGHAAADRTQLRRCGRRVPRWGALRRAVPRRRRVPRRAALGAGRHVLNACADRYRFAVGLGACLARRPGEPAALHAYARGHPASCSGSRRTWCAYR